jgi:signal transduction histidine kinase
MEVKEIKEARIAAEKDRGVKLRYVTEITAENLEYCKEMLKFSEIRHLDGIKGNFEIADEKEYVAVATLHKAQPIPQLIFSNVSEIVEQQQFLFDSLWDKGVPSQHRIREIEKGIIPSITTIFNDYREAEIKEYDMIKKANKEIHILYSSAAAFHLQEKSGVLELLRQTSDQNKDLKINILLPIDSSIRKSLSLELLNRSINQNIKVQNISPSIDIKIKSLITDRKGILLMEIRLAEKDDLTPTPMGFSIFSNSIPTVLSYLSIFEIIRNQSVLSEELIYQAEIKDEFINTAAHELRTPTQAITGFSEMSVELFKDFLINRANMTHKELELLIENLNRYHENIARNASRLDVLINNLLDIARFESNRNGGILLYKGKVDLVQEINDLVSLHFNQKLNNKNIQINFMNNSLGEQYLVNVDKSRLNQVLINFIDNAIKYSNRNDTIHIMIQDKTSFDLQSNDKKESDEDKMNTSDSIDDSYNTILYENRERIKEEEWDEGKEMIYVSISDTGKGISSKILPKLFQKFVTDSDVGTGLGLYISRILVEAHGGKVWAFNNADGIGSTFVFSLPNDKNKL